VAPGRRCAPGRAGFAFMGCSARLVRGAPRPPRSNRQPMTRAEQWLLGGCHPRRRSMWTCVRAASADRWSNSFTMPPERLRGVRSCQAPAFVQLAYELLRMRGSVGKTGFSDTENKATGSTVGGVGKVRHPWERSIPMPHLPPNDHRNQSGHAHPSGRPSGHLLHQTAHCGRSGSSRRALAMHKHTTSSLAAPPRSGLPTVRRALNNRAPTRLIGRQPGRQGDRTEPCRMGIMRSVRSTFLFGGCIDWGRGR
jgi:hypothetical protein